jgi:hypothetical protein
MKVLSLRSSAWTDSLPQALSNPDLRSAQARYELAFRGLPGSSRSHVTGAAFVIDGKLVGVETYRSPELFRQMWPQLLRAYSTEAIAAPKRASTPLPSAGALHKLLAAARAKTDDGWTIEHSTSVHETDDLFYSEVRDADGVMIAASYLPKALAARNVMTPDALVVDMLEHDKLDSLTDSNRIAFARDAAGVWSAAISAPAISAPLAESGGTSIPSQPPAAPRFAAGWPILAAYMGVFAVLLLRRRLLSLCKRLAVPVLNGSMSLNIYTKVGLVTLIGLISKHGILIVQFANHLQAEQGLSKREAIEQAAGIRLRPILMTTAAMVFGVVPLIIASGAGAVSRFQMGIVIASGLTIGTLFTLLVVPAVYLVIAADHHRSAEEESVAAPHAAGA